MTERPAPGLHWGIKASFLDYVSRMPDGKGSVGNGATPADGNVIVFEPAPTSAHDGPRDADLVLAFRGDVRFAGHHGLLYVRIADPWITVSGNVADLTVLDPYKPDEEPRLPLVRFSLVPHRNGDGSRTWSSSDVRLTPEGTSLFNEVYPAGEPFEPLHVFLPRTTSREEAT